jgi:hypothetical protein
LLQDTPRFLDFDAAQAHAAELKRTLTAARTMGMRLMTQSS